jgi:hypothetical protein
MNTLKELMLAEPGRLADVVRDNLVITPALACKIISALESVARERSEPNELVWGHPPRPRPFFDLSESLLEALSDYYERRNCGRSEGQPSNG